MNTLGLFIATDQTAEFKMGMPAEDSSYPPKMVLDDSLKAGIELVCIEEAEGGVVAIVPKHLADHIVHALNFYADHVELYELDSVIPLRKKNSE